MADLPQKPEWTVRRRIIIAALAWCALAATYIITLGKNDALRQQAFVAIVGLAGTIIPAYVFGAAWDDRNWLRIAHAARVQPVGCPDSGGDAERDRGGGDADPPTEPEKSPD